MTARTRGSLGMVNGYGSMRPVMSITSIRQSVYTGDVAIATEHSGLVGAYGTVEDRFAAARSEEHGITLFAAFLSREGRET